MIRIWYIVAGESKLPLLLLKAWVGSPFGFGFDLDFFELFAACLGLQAVHVQGFGWIPGGYRVDTATKLTVFVCVLAASAEGFGSGPLLPAFNCCWVKWS